MQNAAVIVLVFARACLAQPATQPAGPKPRAIQPPSAAEVERSIRRGTQFLLGYQNADGSWGSARRTKNLNIYAPVPGAHHAFRVAVTSLCVSALLEAGAEAEPVRQAVDRGESYLMRELPKVRRGAPRALYNVWAHAYGIAAMVRLANRRPNDQARRREIRRRIDQQIDLLRRFESVNGGWGYYDFRHRTKRPASSSTSFVTAAVLVALHQADSLGCKVPKELTDRAVQSLVLQQNPDFSYLYSEGFRFYRGRGICRPAGSLGRSQACNLALRLWGNKRITDAVLKTWLDRLYARNGWLSRARKMPVPHESWFQVAGYFYYYGHFYAAGCIEQLPLADRAHFQDHLARILLDLQEKDGSWWDYPMYDYHQSWGTAFTLMALKRCIKP